MDNEMINRVTYTIMKAFFDREPDENGVRIFTASPVDNEDLAIAAIKAMREPTEKMKTLVTDDIVITDKCYYCGGHIQGWQAMIDAVIND